jgi:hypothetical protein
MNKVMTLANASLHTFGLYSQATFKTEFQKYRNSTEIITVYRYGVVVQGCFKSGLGLIGTHSVNNKLYRANQPFGLEKDGVSCEK